MSLITQINTLATRIGTEFKAIRTLIGGSGTADISALTTTDKTSLVAAINEVQSEVGSGGTQPDASETVKGILELATQAETDTGTDDLRAVTPLKFQTRLAAYAQPLDSDLTSIAALTTTAFGRGLLTLADSAALRGQVGAATESATGVVELATLAEMATGTDTTRVATVAGVRQERTALKAEILGAGVPAALDTLDELAAALADDANFAASVTTSLSGKQPLDTELTAIAGLTSAADRLPYFNGAGTAALAVFTAAGRALVDDADVAAQRTTLSVYSQAEIGNPETDFSATFVTALA